MARYLFAIATLVLLSTYAQAGTFKVKLKIDLVDHSNPSGTAVKVLEKNQEVALERADSDGEIKLELEKGKLFEIWIVKEGYIASLISNVHAEGKSKFDITLYKNNSKVKFDEANRVGFAWYIDDVKKMTIPAEYLADGVTVIKKDALTKDQLVGLKVVAKVSKSQRKAQKKMDKLYSKKESLEKKAVNADSDFTAGKMSEMEIEEYRLKNQKAIVKIQKSIEKLVY